MEENLVFKKFAGQRNLLDAATLEELDLSAEFGDAEPLHFFSELSESWIGMTFDGGYVDFVTASVAMLGDFDRKTPPACNDANFGCERF